MSHIGEFSDIPVIEIMVAPGDTVSEEDPLVTSKVTSHHGCTGTYSRHHSRILVRWAIRCRRALHC